MSCSQAKSRRRADICRILVFVKRHRSSCEFIIDFVFSLYDQIVLKKIDEEPGYSVLAETLSAAVPWLRLRSANCWSLRRHTTQDQQIAHADRMVRLLHCCISSGLEDEEKKLLEHFWLDAQAADATTLYHVFLPYLKKLLDMMHINHIPLTSQPYQNQFQQVMTYFIARYIGREPPRQLADLAYPILGCGTQDKPFECRPCLDLDVFLVDADKHIWTVSVDTDISNHLANQIKGFNYLQMTVLLQDIEGQRCTTQFTKTRMLPREDDMHMLWRWRAVYMSRLMQEICGDEQWRLLLADRYDECTQLRAVRLS